MGFTMIISFAFPVTIMVVAIVVAKKNGYGYINNKTISKKDTPFFRKYHVIKIYIMPIFD